MIIYFNTFSKNDTTRHINIGVVFFYKVSQFGEEKMELVNVLQRVFPETNGPNCHIMRKGKKSDATIFRC
jgi:hypothetical protein